MGIIDIEHMSMRYPNGRGVFDIGLNVPQGTITGILGPNGAGKTSLIRVLLGFMPKEGKAELFGGFDAFGFAFKNTRRIGFIAGEIALPANLSGEEYLDLARDIRLSELDRAVRAETAAKIAANRAELVKLFEFDSRQIIKKMSKGMKQKVAIVAAFMHEPDLFILDEPTSGLDPLMQARFDRLILEYKNKGKTFFISSHIFEEMEKVCDRIVFIKDGRLTDDRAYGAKHADGGARVYIIKVERGVPNLSFDCKETAPNVYEVTVPAGKLRTFIKELESVELADLESKVVKLEDVFLDYYKN